MLANVFMRTSAYATFEQKLTTIKKKIFSRIILLHIENTFIGSSKHRKYTMGQLYLLLDQNPEDSPQLLCRQPCTYPMEVPN